MIIGISGKLQSGKDTVGEIIQFLTSTNGITDWKVWKSLKCNGNGCSSWKIKKFAGKLKECVSIITGIAPNELEREDIKNMELGVEWDTILPITELSEHTAVSGGSTTYKMTVRKLLQKLGTDTCRQIHPNTWVNALFSEYICTHADRAPNGIDCPNWIITDTRFLNEAQAIKDRKGIIIRVNRYKPDGCIKDLIFNKNCVADTVCYDCDNYKYKSTHPSETALDDYNFDYTIDNNGTIEELIVKVKEILIKEKII